MRECSFDGQSVRLKTGRSWFDPSRSHDRGKVVQLAGPPAVTRAMSVRFRPFPCGGNRGEGKGPPVPCKDGPPGAIPGRSMQWFDNQGEGNAVSRLLRRQEKAGSNPAALIGPVRLGAWHGSRGPAAHRSPALVQEFRHVRSVNGIGSAAGSEIAHLVEQLLREQSVEGSTPSLNWQGLTPRGSSPHHGWVYSLRKRAGPGRSPLFGGPRGRSRVRKSRAATAPATPCPAASRRVDTAGPQREQRSACRKGGRQSADAYRSLARLKPDSADGMGRTTVGLPGLPH